MSSLRQSDPTSLQSGRRVHEDETCIVRSALRRLYNDQLLVGSSCARGYQVRAANSKSGAGGSYQNVQLSRETPYHRILCTENLHEDTERYTFSALTHSVLATLGSRILLLDLCSNLVELLRF